MKNLTVTFIQARTNSSRLKEKMKLSLGKYQIIEWVILRLLNTKLSEHLVLLTTKNKIDDWLVDTANNFGLKTYRGSENNLIERFYLASQKYDVKNVVRVCADNPFIDPAEVDKLICFFNKKANLDYAFNHQNRLNNGYADGFGAEIFTTDCLSKIYHQKTTKYEKEHVTSFIWNNLEKFKIGTMEAKGPLFNPTLRFDIDTDKDFAQLHKLIDLGVDINSSAENIINTSFLLKND
ncbi:hypothetical protein N9P77_01715 [Amylibacter sp.]|nr:hypothetical protein [Amylibacter sp.]